MSELPGGPDVLVVGGGPAGSTAAGLLSAEGWDVLLVDRARFPRPKPCGECLNPGAVRMLDRLGLLDTVRALDPRPLHGWRLRSGTRAVDATFPEGLEGLAVSRTLLDHALLTEAGRRGTRVREGWRVERLGPSGDGGRGPDVGLVGPGGRRVELQPRLVIGADGLRSTVARALGAVRRPARLRKLSLTAHLAVHVRSDARRGSLHLGPDGTVGLAPVGAGRWNATVVVDPDRFGRRIAGRPDAFLMERVARAEPRWRGSVRLEEGPWATGPFDAPVRSPWAPGVLLVGDAAGYYDPLTGQGIYRALLSASLAATAASEVLGRDGALVAGPGPRYARALKRAFGPGRMLQRAIESVVSKGWSRAAAFALLERVPRAADALIAATGDAWSEAPGLAPTRTTALVGAG